MIRFAKGRQSCIHLTLVFSIGFTLTALSGCGGGDVKGGRPRVDASGTATFDGKPIPYGGVLFTHVESGNTSQCMVIDGKYASESGAGPLQGENVVSVAGLEKEDGKPLWSGNWSTTLNVGTEDITQTFNVPANEVGKADANYVNPDAEDE
jgi:hypothetical protein